MRVHYLLGTELVLEPLLAETMFRDRAIQFSDRHGWDVKVDSMLRERDAYDNENPIHVVISNSNGSHVGSLRLLPTTGSTMVNDFFSNCFGGRPIVDTEIWECTRFCISQSAHRSTSALLLAATGKLMKAVGIKALVAVFDESMKRSYQILGVKPEIMGNSEISGDRIFGGMWGFSESTLKDLIRKTRLEPYELELAIANSSLGKHPIFDRQFRRSSLSSYSEAIVRYEELPIA